jgi:hypothetical protein
MILAKSIGQSLGISGRSPPITASATAKTLPGISTYGTLQVNNCQQIIPKLYTSTFSEYSLFSSSFKTSGAYYIISH